MTTESTVDRRTWIVVLSVAGAVAVVAGLIASSGEVPGWEQSIFHTINDLPDWLEAPMWVLQLAGLLLVPLVLAFAAAAFKHWSLAIALVFFIPLKLLVEKGVVKQLVERERPGTTVCGYDASSPDAFDAGCGRFRGDVPLHGLSFVSGHAIIAWGVAALLWTVLPGRWRWVPVALATLNAIARVYLGAHNPLDVVGGGAIGVAMAALLIIAASLSTPDRRRSAGRGTSNPSRPADPRVSSRSGDAQTSATMVPSTHVLRRELLVMTPSVRRPLLLSIVTIFMIISGVVSVAFGIALVLLRNNDELLSDSGEESSTLMTIGLMTIIAGLISIWLATALRNGSRFARMLVFVFEAVHIIGAIWALVALHDQYRVHSVATIIVSLAVIGYLYASAGAKAFFHGT